LDPICPRRAGNKGRNSEGAGDSRYTASIEGHLTPATACRPLANAG
jgi:hypothetical protein